MSSRTPPAPPALAEWMERFGGASPGADGEALWTAALRALEEALARPGRSRDGAYALLAADALLTYAVEDAVDLDDPEAALEELLRRVAALSGDEGDDE